MALQDLVGQTGTIAGHDGTYRVIKADPARTDHENGVAVTRPRLKAQSVATHTAVIDLKRVEVPNGLVNWFDPADFTPTP